MTWCIIKEWARAGRPASGPRGMDCTQKLLYHLAKGVQQWLLFVISSLLVMQKTFIFGTSTHRQIGESANRWIEESAIPRNH